MSDAARTQMSDVVCQVAAQWTRFVTVGVVNTALSTAVYAGLTHVGVHYLVASTIAFMIGAVNSYTLNRRWTFRSAARRTPEFMRFLCVQVVGLGVNLALLAVLVEVVSFHHIIAQMLAFPASSAVTFTLARTWVFAGRSPTGARAGQA